MDYLNTVSVAVLDCKQNVSFIVFHRVVYFMKRMVYGEKPYGENPQKKKSPTLFDAHGEKPYTIFANCGEKPYTNFSDRGEKPYNPKNSVV